MSYSRIQRTGKSDSVKRRSNCRLISYRYSSSAKSRTVIFFRNQRENHCVTKQGVGMSILPWITPFLVRGHAYTLRGVSSKPRVFAGILQYFFVYHRDRRPLEVCVYSAIVLLSCLYSFEAHREWDLTQGQEQSPWFVLSYQRESTLVHLFTSGVSGKRYEKTC